AHTRRVPLGEQRILVPHTRAAAFAAHPPALEWEPIRAIRNGRGVLRFKVPHNRAAGGQGRRRGARAWSRVDGTLLRTPEKHAHDAGVRLRPWDDAEIQFLTAVQVHEGENV